MNESSLKLRFTLLTHMKLWFVCFFILQLYFPFIKSLEVFLMFINLVCNWHFHARWSKIKTDSKKILNYDNFLDTITTYPVYPLSFMKSTFFVIICTYKNYSGFLNINSWLEERGGGVGVGVALTFPEMNEETCLGKEKGLTVDMWSCAGMCWHVPKG